MRRRECRACGNDSPEVVYDVRGSVKWPRERSWTPGRFYLCQACFDLGPTPMSEWHTTRVRWYRVHGRGELLPPTPCENCGLLFVRNADPLLRRMTCSDSCLSSLTRIRNGNQGSGQPCGMCGELITTGRADSKFCGSACRQKAYRERNARA